MKLHRVFAAAAVVMLSLSSCVSTPGGTDAGTTAVSPAPTQAADMATLIEKGDTEGIQALFKGREMVDKPGADGLYPLHAATLKKAADIVEILLAMGATPDVRDAAGKTPLRYAVDQGDAASVKALVKRGASLFALDAAGVSPLDAAIAKGSVASLVDKSNAGSRGDKGETPLHVAVDRLSVDAVKAVLALEPDLAAKDSSGATALDYAFFHPASPAAAAIAELLVSRNAPSAIDEFAYFIRAVRDTNYARARFADGATVLHEAVRYDHRGFLAFFLERGVPVDAKNGLGDSPLHVAVRLGRADAARLLLEKGADANAKDGSGSSPLHLALAKPDDRAMVDLLFSFGADPSVKDKAGDTALHAAVKRGYGTELAGLVIRKGAPVDAANAAGNTALIIAVKARDAAMASSLIGAGASMFVKNVAGESSLSLALGLGLDSLKAVVGSSSKAARDDSGDCPYHYAVRQRAGAEAIALIRELGVDPSMRNNEGDTALHLAVRANAKVQGEALLTAGSDPYATNAAGDSPLSLALSASGGPLLWFFTAQVLATRDSTGNGPLHYAAMAALPAGAEFLVSKGVPVDDRDRDGRTPLMIAMRKDSTATVSVLLALGADPWARDSSGSTALHLAVQWHAVECLKLLARSAPSMDPRDFTGKTPLREAVDRADAAATAFLLERGANPLARDDSGETPLHAAARQGDERYVTALATKARRLDTRDDAGTTPLLEAVYAENAKTAKVLSGLGASIHARDSSGESPLSYALKKDGAVLKAILDDKAARSLDADGRSVLRVIIDVKPSVELLGLALAAGASPDDRDTFGRSPLHAAVAKGYLDAAARLVAAGADPFSRDAEGATPTSLAFAAGEGAIRALFADEPDAANYLGETALHYAAAAGLEKAAQVLLALGADRNRRNALGETPADVARRRGYESLAVVLAVK